MFSNKHRKTKISACFFIVLLLCINSSVQGPKRSVTMRKIINHPEHYPARFLVKQCVKMRNVFENGFYFIEEKKRYKAIYVGKKEMPIFEESAYVSISGRVKGVTLFFNDYHVHKYRLLKIILSIIALFGVCIYLVLFFFSGWRTHMRKGKKCNA